YSTPAKVLDWPTESDGDDDAMVTLRSDTFRSTPVKKGKRTCLNKSPGMRKSPRLAKMNIEAQVHKDEGGSMRKLFLEVDDTVNSVTEAEYENIQLDNENEDECHPIDDDRSPVSSDNEEEDLELGQFSKLLMQMLYDQ
ncbi:hypothetical protein MKW94_012089, partial [Papaver nudicaule]|nr:hypothetical protein [Papaver nudicaule]